MAAHSSPRGFTPAAREGLVGNPVLGVADAVESEGVGEALGRVDGQDEDLQPWRTAAMSGRRPPPWSSCPPPGTAGDDDLLGGQQAVHGRCGRVGAPCPCGRAARAAIRAQLLAERAGHLAGGAQPVGPGEQVRQVEQRARRGRCPRAGARDGSERVRRMVTARRAASRTGPASPPTSPSSSARGPGAARASKTASSLAAEQLGQHPVDHDRRPARTVVSSRTRPASSMVSLTGISSGVHTASRPVVAGSDSISSIQSVCERISPTLTSSLMAWGAASWPTMWPVAGASTTTRS